MKKVRLLLFVALSTTCAYVYGQSPIDGEATKKTQNLLQNLHAWAQTNVMFGHQDDQAYGVGWRAEDGRSDVLETAGQFPAVHGWDLGQDLRSEYNIDSVRFDHMKIWIKKAYKRGGINTISWHLDNLTTGSNSWDKTPTVKDILPGGQHHDKFREQLELLALFIKDCGKMPIIFRPWHEHNGDWFWWGKGNCSEDEYITLFKYTVDFLVKEKGIHNLLYAFSPDRSRWDLDQNAKENYFYGYPGDDYVDIIGVDNYGDVGRTGGPNSPEKQREYFIKSLKLITEIAEDKGKVAALSETGLEGVTNAAWFTDIVLNPLKENRKDIKIAWVLVWRNFDTKHHYAPFAGHKSEAAFKTFVADPLTWLEDDLGKSAYKKPKAGK